jgi:hypothetical protein
MLTSQDIALAVGEQPVEVRREQTRRVSEAQASSENGGPQEALLTLRVSFSTGC